MPVSPGNAPVSPQRPGGAGAGRAPSGPVTYVNKEGTGDYTTIQGALNAAVAGEQIIVQGGTYVENLDFTGVPDTVRVNGQANAQNVIISPAVTTAPTVLVTGTHTLRELTVMCPASGTEAGVEFTGGAGRLAVIFGLVIQGAGGTGDGILHNGAGVLACIQGLYHNGGAIGGAVFRQAGAGTSIGLDWIANVGSCGDFVKVEAGALRLENLQFQDDALYSGTNMLNVSGGKVSIAAVELPDNGNEPFVNAIHVSGDGCEVFVSGAPLTSTTYDLIVDGGLVGTGTSLDVQARMNFDKFSIPSGYRDVALTRLNFGTETGWATYVDTANTSGSPQSIASNTRTQWTNNVGTAIETYRPGVTAMWSSNAIQPQALGVAYVIRVDMTIDPDQNNRNFTIDIDIGSDPFGADSNIIVQDSFRLNRGAGAQSVSRTISIFCLADFVANGGAIGVECDGSADIYDKRITVTRIH